jgi:hypothetical protein
MRNRMQNPKVKIFIYIHLCARYLQKLVTSNDWSVLYKIVIVNYILYCKLLSIFLEIYFMTSCFLFYFIIKTISTSTWECTPNGIYGILNKWTVMKWEVVPQYLTSYITNLVSCLAVHSYLCNIKFSCQQSLYVLSPLHWRILPLA